MNISDTRSIDLKRTLRESIRFEVGVLFKISLRQRLEDQPSREELRQRRGVGDPSDMQLALMHETSPPFKNQSLMQEEFTNLSAVNALPLKNQGDYLFRGFTSISLKVAT